VVEVDRALVRESNIELSPRGAALALGVSPDTIKRRCKQGAYPGASNEGWGWRIPIDALL
jgi:hypothetical protein